MKKIDINDLVNLWLEKYHNTNIDKILEENPTWKKNPSEHTKEFYDKYPVTQEQHDTWMIEAKQLIKKVTKASKKSIEHDWPWIFLDCSPNIIKQE